MRISIRMTYLSGASLLALLAAAPAGAQTVYSAQGSVSANGDTASTVSQTGSMSVSVTKTVSDPAGPLAVNTATTTDFGYAPSIGFETSTGGQGIYDASGSFNESRTITNRSNATFDYKLTYLIGEGEIQVNVPTGTIVRPFSDGTNPADVATVSVTGGVSAGVEATIKLNGAVQLDYAASLTQTGAGVSPTFSESGLTLNAAGPSIGTSSGSYTWGVTTGTIDLGVYAPNQSFTLSYNAASFGSGNTVGSTPQLCGDQMMTGYVAHECAGGPSLAGTSNAYFDDPTSVSSPGVDPFGLAVTYVSGGSGGGSGGGGGGGGGGSGGGGGGGGGSGGGGYAGDPLSLDGSGGGGTGVPEPATAALIGAGVLALASFRRRR